MKKILSVVVLVALAQLGSVALAADAAGVKIGTVDMQQALQTVAAGKKARSELEREFNKKKDELQKEEASIKKMHEEFQKQSLVMNEQTRGKKQAELQQRIMKFQEETGRSQMEIQKKEQELTAPIIKNIRKIIQGMAGKKGYTVILEKNENTVLFSLPQDDLTSDVIETYNKENKS